MHYHHHNIIYISVVLDLFPCPPICLLRPFSAAINLTFYIISSKDEVNTQYHTYFYKHNAYIYTLGDDDDGYVPVLPILLSLHTWIAFAAKHTCIQRAKVEETFCCSMSLVELITVVVVVIFFKHNSSSLI